MPLPPFLARLSRRARGCVGILAALPALYALLGFLVLPAVLVRQIPKRLGALTGREVLLRKVRTNPFTLAATFEGFRIQDRDREPLLAWERLSVNLGSSSLFTRTVRFQSIELVEPSGRVVVEKDGRLNFSDILDRLQGASPPAKVEPTPSREVSIGRLAIHGARFVLLDRSPSEPFTTTLGPLSFQLTDFHTGKDSRNPYAFSGRTESGETFAWKGVFSLDPLASRGSLALEQLVLAKYLPYYGDQFAFELKDGRLSTRADYDFQWGAGTHILRLREGSLDLQDLKLAEPGRKAPFLDLPALELRGLEADLLTRKLTLGHVTARNGKLEAQRLPDGRFDLVRLLTPRPSPTPEPPPPPLDLTLRELALEGWRVRFQDLALARPFRTEATDFSLNLEDFSLDPAARTRIAMSFRLDGRARVEAAGTAALLRPEVDLALKIDRLELPPLDAYLGPDLDVRVNQGRLSLDGRLQAVLEGRPSDRTSFKGNLRLERVEAMDGMQQEPFLRYEELRLKGMEFSTQPLGLRLRSADLRGGEHRLVLAKDGSTNVGRALKLETAPAPPKATLGTLLPTTPESSFRATLDELLLARNRLVFVDRSVEPNATLAITDLEGRNTGLSTESGQSAALDLKGKVGGVAPLTIQGRSMPLRRDQDTDVTVRIQGADLSDFTPYTGKYLGYTVRKGQLDLDARVKIEKRTLDALVKTKLDQFYFGDKVQSPEATRIPVKLALALMRDRKGVVSLELPIDGNLDDPDFHYGKIVWKTPLNILAKIAMSPFTLLGNLFGGGSEDLSFVAFAPGTSEPDAAARKKAEVLARSLTERPELTLELEGTADPNADGAALRRIGLDARIRETKIRQLRTQDPRLDSEAVAVLPEERPQWLARTFEATYPAPPPVKGTPKPPPPTAAEMEQRLLASIPLDPAHLRALADHRAKAILRLLVEDGRVDRNRVFEVEGSEPARRQGGSRVFFSLK